MSDSSVSSSPLDDPTDWMWEVQPDDAPASKPHDVSSRLHEQFMAAGERAASHDLRPWTMFNEHDERVGSPCHDADWLDPLLFSATCAECAESYEVADLGIVKGGR